MSYFIYIQYLCKITLTPHSDYWWGYGQKVAKDEQEFTFYARSVGLYVMVSWSGRVCLLVMFRQYVCTNWNPTAEGDGGDERVINTNNQAFSKLLLLLLFLKSLKNAVVSTTRQKNLQMASQQILPMQAKDHKSVKISTEIFILLSDCFSLVVIYLFIYV